MSTIPGRWAPDQLGSWRELLVSYLQALGCDAALAEDVAQEALMAYLAVEQRREWADDRARAYLKGIARHRYLDALRTRGREISADELEVADRAWTELTPDDALADRREALARCMAGLSQRARQVLQLRFAEGASARQIALATGLEVEGVKTILKRSKAALRDCLLRREKRDD